MDNQNDNNQQPSDNGRNNRNNPTPKFNFSWLYILIGVGLLYFIFSQNSLGASAEGETDYTKFKAYIDKGYADKVVIDKKKLTLQMFVKEQHVRDVFGKGKDQVGKNPAVNVEFGSMENLEAFLDKETEEGKFDGKVIYDHDDDWFVTLLWQLGPLVLIIVFWIFAIKACNYYTSIEYLRQYWERKYGVL